MSRIKPVVGFLPNIYRADLIDKMFLGYYVRCRREASGLSNCEIIRQFRSDFEISEEELPTESFRGNLDRIKTFLKHENS